MTGDRSMGEWAYEFSIARDSRNRHMLRKYGLVRLSNGNVIFRNYHRELKNGRGLSFLDLVERAMLRTHEHMRATITNNLYASDQVIIRGS
jgi:hypothetical protein